MTHDAHDDRETDDFERERARKRPGLAREFASFLAENKKWWLAPIVLALLVLGLLVLFGGSAAGPFIYTFF